MIAFDCLVFRIKHPVNNVESTNLIPILKLLMWEHILCMTAVPNLGKDHGAIIYWRIFWSSISSFQEIFLLKTHFSLQFRIIFIIDRAFFAFCDNETFVQFVFEVECELMVLRSWTQMISNSWTFHITFGRNIHGHGFQMHCIYHIMSHWWFQWAVLAILLWNSNWILLNPNCKDFKKSFKVSFRNSHLASARNMLIPK